ncbi:WXG100 family type VII secretion target [Cellulomonas marina]|uniref:ESAT-6-like protein n=1 Tax=Cellulomonas marina TaxID=988821 RepID=A0A1I0WJ67_9CELL|nr:WXG100 family type VII secretion target [Cellulomonas marina]GIG27695.1 hypothetical protein Cma02nite_02950 [Cellulomonas marina]SFA88799.1 WXG100 family type VII secretion target [Cellulomonas marina]
MSRYEVDSEALAASAARVAGITEGLRAQAEALRRELATLEGSWRGAAAAACAEAVTTWAGAHAALQDSLARIEAALGSAARTYGDADAYAARLFAG